LKNNLLSLIKSKTEIRFLLVGAWNTLFGYLVFLLFLFLLEKIFNNERQIYSLSIAFSHLISVINSFILHKVVTFVSKQKGLELVYEFRRFFNSYIITFLLNLSLISIQVELLSLNPRIAGAISLPIVTVVTFFLLSKYAFNKT
jgi:putative flippase GtrA